MTTPLLHEMSFLDLQKLLLDLRKQRADLIAEKTEIQRQWACDKKPTAFSVRAEVLAEIAGVQAEINAVELELSNHDERQRLYRAKKEEERLAKLERWYYSDHMLAALQHICEQHGKRAFITLAREMVSKGWPNLNQSPA